MTLTKCHYVLQREFTKGIFNEDKIYLCRNNYLLSSGDKVIITVKTQLFNLTGDQHVHASVSSASISINEAVMEGITRQENPLQNIFSGVFASFLGDIFYTKWINTGNMKHTEIFLLEVKNISACLKPARESQNNGTNVSQFRTDGANWEKQIQSHSQRYISGFIRQRYKKHSACTGYSVIHISHVCM